jgi:hypothetical protein
MIVVISFSKSVYEDLVMNSSTLFWWLAGVGYVIWLIGYLQREGWEEAWRKSQERNRWMVGGAFKVGRLFLRSYLRHHK